MEAFDELVTLSKKLVDAAAFSEVLEIAQPLEDLKKSADQIKRSFCGSWLGYQSRVYYNGLVPAPPGTHFSQEWGLKDLGLSSTRLGSHGDWREYDFEEVKSAIYAAANNPDLKSARDAVEKANAIFDHAKSEASSILHNELQSQPDTFLDKLKENLEKLEPLSAAEVAEHWSPKGQIITRDITALGQKYQVPPHVAVLAEVASVRHSFSICKAAAEICERAASHLDRKNQRRNADKKRETLGKETDVETGLGRTKKEDWVTAAGALHMLRHALRQGAAVTAICQRANDGMIRTKAERFIADKKVSDNVELPRAFWWAGGEAALEQNWVTGDFETWIDHKHHLRAYGVQFLKSDIQKLIPRLEPGNDDVAADTDLLVPAADRVVRVDHNSAEYSDAMIGIDELELQLRGWNGYRDAEDKEQRLAELKASKSLLKSVRVRVEALVTVVYKALVHIVKLFVDNALGVAAKALLVLIGKMTGLW